MVRPLQGRRLLVVTLCLGIAISAAVPATTKAAVVSTGPVMVAPAPGFGPAHPPGCDPATASSLTLLGTAPFEPPAGPTINTGFAKVSGLPDIVGGQLTLAGDVDLGPQSSSGSSSGPAFDGPILTANGSFSLVGDTASVTGTYSELREAPGGAVSGLNRGSCYGWDRGDLDPVTSAGEVMADLRVAFIGTRTDATGSRSVAGEVSITVRRGCTLVTANTGVCGNSAALVFDLDVPAGCAPPPPDMIGWWRGEFDNVAEVGPDLTGVSAFDQGRVGQGFSMDGGGDALGTPTLPVVDDGLTVEAWIRSDPTGSPATIMSRWDFPSTDDSARSYWFRLDPYPAGSLVFETDETSTRRPDVFTVAMPDPDDTRPRHVAATWSPTAISIYVDGVLIGSKASQGGRLNAAATTPFRIGSQVRGFAFDGVIDEPAVYSRALSASEIASIASAGAVGKCSI